jgi:hypothetical protein
MYATLLEISPTIEKRIIAINASPIIAPIVSAIIRRKI